MLILLSSLFTAILLGGQPVMVDAQAGNPNAYGSDANAPDNAVFVTAAGNVGVGTQDPGSRLMARTDAGGTTNNILSFATYADTGKGSHFGIDTVNRMMYWRITDAYDYGWQFQTNYGEHARMTITKDGNVGIGMYPQATLDVNGTISTKDLNVNGYVGIGTTEPVNPLQILTSGTGTTNNLLTFGTSYDGGQHSRFGIDTANRMMYWRMSSVDYGWQFQTNNGEHARMTITKDGNVGIGMYPQATLDVNGTTSTKVLQITGGSDLAEPFEIANADTIEPGMVVAIDPDNPGQLRLATAAYDRTIAGVVSGAGGINAGVVMYKDGANENTHPVALMGRVYVYADTMNGAIQPGDLLTTASTPGHAMKVTDHEKAQGAILGKAMSKLEKGKGLVLVLVTLQ